jgi:hypothetical protein
MLVVWKDRVLFGNKPPNFLLLSIASWFSTLILLSKVLHKDCSFVCNWGNPLANAPLVFGNPLANLSLGARGAGNPLVNLF